MKTQLWWRMAATVLVVACVSGMARGAVSGVRMPPDDGKLRIIAFGAHPDDAEAQSAGCGMFWAKEGHHVLMVSMTNGDIGHWRQAGGPLAQRRKSELEAAHRIYGEGVQFVVVDNHDGELEPTLENRRTVVRLIRQWNADLVLGPRPLDYHPDHRYTGILMQDAAYMVAVPFFCPDTPALKKNPVFMYYADRFQKPLPSKPDVLVAIDSVIDRKIESLTVMISQFAEGGALGRAGLYPEDSAGQQRRLQEVRQIFGRRLAENAIMFRRELAAKYPGRDVKYAEAFEICEYGAQPTPAELRRLFPFAP